MAIDAICLQAVVEELRPQLLGLRVDNCLLNTTPRPRDNRQ